MTDSTNTITADLLTFVCMVCQELERELELQVGLKQEMEVAMKLLEKDTHEKQDTLAALRLQLDQVKTLNLQMFHKAQVCMCTRTAGSPLLHPPADAI